MTEYKYNEGGWSADYPGKKRKRSPDCVVRAIAIATKQSYKGTLIDLCNLAIEYGCTPNDFWIVEKYLKSKGWVKEKAPRNKSGKKIRLRDWDYKGTALMRTSGHLVAVLDGVVNDTWDCRPWCCNTWWREETE